MGIVVLDRVSPPGGPLPQGVNEVISVVIATRDRPEFLLACLGSLQRSAPLLDWTVEVIVVNNGAHDLAIERAVLRLANRRLATRFLTEARPGKAIAVNTGTAAARGSIVAFLDDDVTVQETWIVEVVEEFRSDPELDLLAGCVRNADPHQRGVAISRNDRAVDIVATCELKGSRPAVTWPPDATSSPPLAAVTLAWVPAGGSPTRTSTSFAESCGQASAPGSLRGPSSFIVPARATAPSSTLAAVARTTSSSFSAEIRPLPGTRGGSSPVYGAISGEDPAAIARPRSESAGTSR